MRIFEGGTLVLPAARLVTSKLDPDKIYLCRWMCYITLATGPIETIFCFTGMVTHRRDYTPLATDRPCTACELGHILEDIEAVLVRSGIVNLMPISVLECKGFTYLFRDWVVATYSRRNTHYFNLEALIAVIASRT